MKFDIEICEEWFAVKEKYVKNFEECFVIKEDEVCVRNTSILASIEEDFINLQK